MKMKKLLSAAFLLSLVVDFISVTPSINAVSILEGAIIKTNHNPNVYIVKYKNGKQFKRLVLNPQVFESYGHLKWENILIISQSDMDSFVISDLVRVNGQTDIYQLVPNGDVGIKVLLTSADGHDLDLVYTINGVDFGNYTNYDKLDNDQDGLSDNIERILGTDINNSDSDGDGYNDFNEIKNGYNPLGTSVEEKYTQGEFEIVKNKIKNENEEFYNKHFKTSGAFVCGTSTVKDIDGNGYNTVSIGSQCWLKENLKVTKNPSGTGITRYCYDNDTNICNTDGGLYEWDTAMDSSNQEGAQGICPNGWHIPSDSDFYILENHLKDTGEKCDSDRLCWGCAGVGRKLEKGGSSGFDAILTGYRCIDGVCLSSKGSFQYRNVNAHWWSSTELSVKPVKEKGDHTEYAYNKASTDIKFKAYWRGIELESQMVSDPRWISRWIPYKTLGCSVRCLKN